MNVLLISTADLAGGGAIATYRLMTALNGYSPDGRQVHARMMVRDKRSREEDIIACGNKLPKLMERLQLMMMMRKPLRQTWQYDTGSFGIDITNERAFREADIIHLHWINQGMLSLSTLKKILDSGKPVVWTLHDEWPYSGLEHYKAEDRTDSEDELRVRDRKHALYRGANIHFVGCSQWITDRAQHAMPWADVRCINNCVPQNIFHPVEQREARKALGLPEDRKVVMFCSQNINDERKGVRYLNDALTMLPDVEVLRIGKGGRVVTDPREMALLYAASDCFVTPSLQDNLPNTIAEAMSCGTPCVAFRVGGIPEMIDHLGNGYLANPRDSRDLARGMEDVLLHPQYREAAAACARKKYSEQNIARLHHQFYQQIL